MKYSTRLSDAVHILVFIQQSNHTTISSSDIAVSIQTNPSYVRQIMAQLKAAGLLISSRGQATPELTKSPQNITLLEIYKAVEKDKPLLHLDTHTNPECGVGVNIQLALAGYYKQIQKDSENSMQKITLQNIIDSYLKGNFYIGGICGLGSDYEISNCSVDIMLKGYYDIGGIVGRSSSGRLTEVSSLSKFIVEGDKGCIGGIIGDSINSNTIKSSISDEIGRAHV